MGEGGFSITGSRTAATPTGYGRALPLDPMKEEPLVDPREGTLFDSTGSGDQTEPARIETGTALALTDFVPPALGAGDRLVRLAT